MAAIAGYNAQFYITSVPSVSMANEAMTDSGDHKTFNVTNAAHQCWDKSASFVVQTSPDGSTWTTVTTGFVINYAIGQIVFASAVSGATPSCRVASGKYFPFSFLGFCTALEPSISSSALDVTAMTNPPTAWKTFIAGVIEAKIKITKWWIDGTFLNHISNGDLLILRIFPGQNANQRFQGYGVLTADSLKVAVGAAISEELEFEVDGQLYYIGS